MRNQTSELYLPPDVGQITQEDLWRWFQNVPRELEVLPLSIAERAAFAGYYRGAGLLRAWRRPFFRHHYARPLYLSVRALFRESPPLRVVDLGCGTGSQALLFALLGAEVVAVDADEVALSILEKRRRLYEQRAGRKLRIDVRSGDVFTQDFAAMAPIGGVYSLFAFNMMQPTHKLLDELRPHLSDRAVMVIQDGNRAHFYNRIFRRRNLAASAAELRSAMRALGFEHVEQIGAYAIPPLLWSIAPADALARLDTWLADHELLAVSYLHIARRRP